MERYLNTTSNLCGRCKLGCLKSMNSTGRCTQCPLGYKYKEETNECLILEEVEQEIQKQEKLGIEIELAYFDKIETAVHFQPPVSKTQK